MTAGSGSQGREGPESGSGAGERMSDLEGLMWRLGQHDPRLLSTMSMLILFDRPLDRDLLLQRFEQVTLRVPRLRCRVRPTALPSVPPRWEADPEFSLGRHVQVVRGVSAPPVGAPLGELVRVAEDVVSCPLSAGQPPWRAVLVPGDADALVLHLHHSYTDGLGGVRLLGELFDLMAVGAGPSRAVGGAGAGGGAAGAGGAGGGAGGARAGAGAVLEALTDDLQFALRRSAALARSALPWGVRSVRGASAEPSGWLDAAFEAGRSARSALADAAGPASPVLRGRSDGTVLATLSVPLDSLRRAGRRLGATVNDVYLAALLEGLARYHEKCAALPPSLRLAVPMSARPDGEDDLLMQNQLQGALLRGPLGPLDFDERTRLIHQMVALARRQPWLGMADAAAGFGLRTPGLVRVIAAGLCSLDVVASNITGPTLPLVLGGAEAQAMVPFGPRSGSALNATLLSYSGSAHIGLNIDPEAVTDPMALVDCIGTVLEDQLIQAPAVT